MCKAGKSHGETNWVICNVLNKVLFIMFSLLSENYKITVMHLLTFHVEI